MGSWGPGLYSGDDALDIRKTISAVLRLPFDNEKLLELIQESFSVAADDPDGDDDDYSVFWLVVADQFHSKGIDMPEVFERAVSIIESGRDLNECKALEMSGGDLKKRAANLQALKDQLQTPVPAKPRKTLSKPQPFALEVGDVFTYPIAKHGAPKYRKADDDFQGVAWGAAVVTDRGRVFDYLAYYATATVFNPLKDKPTLDDLLKHEGWEFEQAGTCKADYPKVAMFEFLGKVDIDENKLAKRRTTAVYERSHAISDISIANQLYIRDKKETHREFVTSERHGCEGVFDSLSEITR